MAYIATPRRLRHRTPLLPLPLFLVSLVAVAGLAACGSDEPSSAPANPASGSTASASSSPEDLRADDAAVAAGLGRMVTTSGSVAVKVAAGSKVDDAGQQLEADWKEVEGTVKANDPDLYLRIEDAIGGLDTAGKAGDVAGSAKVAAELAGAVTAYTAKYP